MEDIIMENIVDQVGHVKWKDIKVGNQLCDRFTAIWTVDAKKNRPPRFMLSHTVYNVTTRNSILKGQEKGYCQYGEEEKS